MADNPAVPALPAKTKRSLFNRPKWAQAPPPDPESLSDKASAPNPDDVFSRSKQNYDAIRKDQEQKRKRKEEKARLKAEQEEARKLQDLTSSSIKRRKVTDDDYARFGVSRSSSKQPRSEIQEQDIGQDASSPSVQKHPAPSNDKVEETPLPPPCPCKPSPPLGAVVIDIDSDAEHAPIATTARPDDSDDEEFAELAAAARERQRQLQIGSTTDKTHRSPSLATNANSAAPASNPPDPVLKLLVTSRIPGTEPLLVYRKASQRLQEVREAWCKKQGFHQTMTDSVFLTYKMRKLHDITSCKSLGVEKARADDDMFMDNEEVRAGHDLNDKIALEAVTEEIFEQQKQARQAERARRAGRGPYPDPVLPPRPDSPDREELIKVILCAKGHADHKLKVKKVEYRRIFSVMHMHMSESRLTVK